MENRVEISLIIPFYKRLEFLELIFRGIENQSFKNFEVIIAEDADAAETVKFLSEARKTYGFPIRHVSQEDNGFRKSVIMNKAVLASEADFIVFIDGDCIPHRHFLKQYSENKEAGYALFGRRVMLSKKMTEKLIKNKSVKSINIFNLLLSNSKSVEEAFYIPFRKYRNSYRGICGCNWGINKQHLIDVNGFDEDYPFACVAEDTDIEWRLKKTGIKLKKMKNKAIVYHLYHTANYSREQIDTNEKILALKLEKEKPVCNNGINKI